MTKTIFAFACIALLLLGCSQRSPAITVSSVSNNFGGDGLLESMEPGWHAASPPHYPETITVNLGNDQIIGSVAMLPQAGQKNRFAKAVRIDASADGETWRPIAGADNICEGRTRDGWADISFTPTKVRYLKILIFSNCGDKSLLTVQGVRFSG